MISDKVCNVDLQSLRKMPLKRPTNAGSQWQGIRHWELIESLYKAVREREGLADSFRGWISPDRMDFVAAFEVRNGPQVPHGVSPWFGVFTSNSRRKSMQFFAGIYETATHTPLVLDMFGSEHKKTINFDLDYETDKAVNIWKQRVGQAKVMLPYLKGVTIDANQSMRLLFTAGRRHIIPWSRVGRVDHLFAKETHRTAWNLLRAFSSVNATAPAADQMVRNLCFCQLFPVKSNLVA